MKKLWFCILMDMLGFVTYAIPITGEWGDIFWAPLSAFIFYKTFAGKIGKVGAFINFLEEIVPFTDFIPTFTIAYFYDKRKLDKVKP